MRTATSSTRRSGSANPYCSSCARWNAAARSGCSGTRQLERLSGVAQVRFALVGQLPRFRERHEIRPHRVSPLLATRRARARRGRPRLRERAPSRIPSSSASSQACSGPAPPNATSAKSRGSWPRSTDTTRSARSISALTTSIDRRRVDPAERALGRVPVELDAARELGREAPEQQVRVGDRRPASRLVRNRPGPGSAPALSGPTRSAPPASRQTIEPPPAPTVCRSTVGSRIGRPPTVRSLARVGAGRSTIRHTSVDVPPMSNAIAFSMPAERREPRCADDSCSRARDERRSPDAPRPRRASRLRPTSA